MTRLSLNLNNVSLLNSSQNKLRDTDKLTSPELL